MKTPTSSASRLINRALSALAAIVLLGLCHPAGAQSDLDRASSLFAAQDWDGARDAALPLAASGDARAMLLLGLMTERGLGSPADPTAARDWYRRALDADPVLGAAALQLGLMTERGEGGAVDKAAALRLYRQGAAGGLPEAAYNAGRLLLDPEAGPADPLAALLQLDAAARRGVAPAEEAVRVLSRDVARDPPIVGRWQVVDVTAAADDPFWAAAPPEALFGAGIDIGPGTMRIAGTACERANFLQVRADRAFGLTFAGATPPVGLEGLFRAPDLAVFATLCDGAPGPTLLLDGTGALRAVLLGRVAYVSEPRPSPLVAAVQSALAARGVRVGTPDGVVGPLSRGAIAALRAAAGFSAVPAINRRTLDLLGIPGP